MMTSGGRDGWANGHRRAHIVLVPGFVGFDALGQVEYYAGVSGLFDTWKRLSAKADQAATIHYFDNFPTASVAVRASRLREYLTKRIARGEFVKGDSLALVGHSTGGLDIRKALHDMAKDPGQRITVDGFCHVTHQEVLDLVDHVAFLSVPQYGTNIADFTCRLRATTQVLLRNAAFAIKLNREPVASARRLLSGFMRETPSSLLCAIRDALNESDEDLGGSPEQRADEREARAELSLWLDHMSKDFGIIEDLRSSSPSIEGSTSPAHYNAAERAHEMDQWKRCGIRTRSYATRVPHGVVSSPLVDRLLPFIERATPVVDAASSLTNKGAALWFLPLVSTSSQLARAAIPASAALLALPLLHQRPGILFELFHAICADPRGPFENPNRRVKDAIAPQVTRLSSGEIVETSSLRTGDSDGVVNTLSMFWPYDGSDPDAHLTYLVDGDHGDIIGHYAMKKAPQGSLNGRFYYAYDFFQSGTGFDDASFSAVWNDVFDFCTTESV